MAQVAFTLNSNDIPRLHISLFGDWDRTVRMVNSLENGIKVASYKAQMKVCKEIEKRVKAHLRNNDLGWTALDADYAKKKSSHNLDGRTLIAYGAYYHAITTWTPSGRNIVNVGVKKGKYTQKIGGGRSKLEIAAIAAIHEFSTGKLPRRPLWNPTIQEMGGPNGIKKMYVNSLIWHLGRMGIPVKNFRNIL